MSSILELARSFKNSWVSLLPMSSLLELNEAITEFEEADIEPTEYREKAVKVKINNIEAWVPYQIREKSETYQKAWILSKKLIGLRFKYNLTEKSNVYELEDGTLLRLPKSKVLLKIRAYDIFSLGFVEYIMNSGKNTRNEEEKVE